ncbi:MAG TPA: VIT1/CCC1 transporter family protein [Candidatus Dormibacteraeota bacterium]|jgi:VIT1/CCC1 family predicted Fe2+/Mn2+ transporter|nr:VIT1/CCC1 transporter family protein [Candidatus Dormibacteraeota bacterium]
MPQTRHVERHFTGGETVRDVVIGMADGLTVPFALAAGLSGAVASAHVVVVAGLAEIAAGSIAMGLGGFLAAKSDAEHYEQEWAREKKEIETIPEAEASEVSEVFESYGLTREESQPVVAALRQKPEAWVNFMMRFELGLEQPHRGRALGSALTIAGSYAIGGLVPLFPYMLLTQLHSAFLLSVTVTLLALFVFGYVKGRYTGAAPMRGAIQTVIIGALASGAAYLIAKWIA